MTVQGVRSALHTATAGVTSAVDALRWRSWSPTNLVSAALQDQGGAGGGEGPLRGGALAML